MVLQKCASGAEDKKALKKIKLHVTYRAIPYPFLTRVNPTYPRIGFRGIA
jgi:hypothetical protein